MESRLSRVAAGVTIALGVAASGLHGASADGKVTDGEVNVYSYRQPFLVQPLFKAFTEATGIEVNVVFAKKGLVQRLKSEGDNSPADLILTVTAHRLEQAYEAGVTQAVVTDALLEAIPEQYRDDDHHWWGMTTRARIIYASRDRVPPGSISTYEDLADPRWKGRVCSRSGKNGYNVALFASMIAHHGEEKTEEWLRGFKANLARKPQGNDRAQVRAIKEGECDIGVGNHYYYGKMLQNEEQRPWADSVYLVFPNQDGRGTHVNISGVALTRASPNRENAVRLMEFLAGPGQTLYARQNYEYPVRPGVPWLPEVEAWGRFRADSLDLAVLTDHRNTVIKMVDRVAFDQ